MLIGGRLQLVVRDPVPARGHPDHHQDHTQEGEMTTLLPQKEKKNIMSNHQSTQKKMISVKSGGPVLLILIIEMTAVMLIIDTMSEFCS
jgi:hypothetical protein